MKENIEIFIAWCGIYMTDDKFTTTAALFYLHPSVGTHWVVYIYQYNFDSYIIIHFS